MPGDVLLLAEGDRISADARLLAGAVEVDLSTLTGESQPVLARRTSATRRAAARGARARLQRHDVRRRRGEALVVRDRHADGARPDRGAHRAGRRRREPARAQVRRVAWLIALVAVGAGLAFLPIGWLVAGLPLEDAFLFAVGLIVANVPEGLLPTITLALAVGVAELARQGALVKRLSAVETLGSTTVICTDKTGTLTENRMRRCRHLDALGEVDLEAAADGGESALPESGLGLLGRAIAACSTAELAPRRGGKSRGEATEIGLLEAASALGVDVARRPARARPAPLYRFDPKLRLMSSVDERRDGGLTVHAKGAPEEVLARSTALGVTPTDTCRSARATAPGCSRWSSATRRRVSACSRSRGGGCPKGTPPPEQREDAERDLVLLGLVALFDPPRPEVAEAVRAAAAPASASSSSQATTASQHMLSSATRTAPPDRCSGPCGRSCSSRDRSCRQMRPRRSP